MKAFAANLQSSVSSIYNKAITSLIGTVTQKTINGQLVTGPALTQFIDVFTQTGLAPVTSVFNSATNQMFILAGATPTPAVLLYNFDTVTGVYSYVGKVTLNLLQASTTTHTFRAFKVNVTGSVISIILGTTGSVLINGGVFVAANLAAADFTLAGTNIFAASGAGQKALYSYQDPTAYGANNTLTTVGGASAPSTIGTRLYVQNGTAAAMYISTMDLAVTPAVLGLVTNGINSQASFYAGTSCYFTMGNSNNGYQAITPTAALFEAVSLLNGTGNVPTNFTAWAPGSAQVTATSIVYLRDLIQVGGNWYFNLSTTPAGAAVIPTASTAFSMVRSGGVSTNGFVGTKAGPYVLSGTLLQANSFQYAKPTSAPANPALNAVDCLSFATSTTLYMGKLSEVTGGSASWPSLTPVTLVGLSTVVAPTAIFATYSTIVDKWIYATNTSSFVTLSHQAAAITAEFGGTVNSWLEGNAEPTVQFGLAAVGGLSANNNWLLLTGTTAGQRGVVFMNIASDATVGSSGVISPVLQVPAGSIFKTISTLEQDFDFTDSMSFYIRSAATATDAVFNSATGGWVSIATAKDLSATAIGPYFQLMAQFNVLTFDANSPSQLNDFIYAVQLPGESATEFGLDVDSTTVGTSTPSYVGFTCIQVPSVLPTALFVKGYDINGNVLINDSTTASLAKFSYSTDGVTWNAITNLATQVFVVGNKTRYNVAAPPGVETLMSLRYSA